MLAEGGRGLVKGGWKVQCDIVLPIQLDLRYPLHLLPQSQKNIIDSPLKWRRFHRNKLLKILISEYFQTNIVQGILLQ